MFKKKQQHFNNKLINVWINRKKKIQMTCIPNHYGVVIATICVDCPV